MDIKEKIQVRCIDTGVVFTSARTAAEYYSTRSEEIIECCEHKRETACGYHWEFEK